MSQNSNLIIRLAPAIFVVLWATGYVGAKFGTRDMEPFIFLAIRFGLTFIILLPLALWMCRKDRPNLSEIGHSLFAGVLMQAVYLGGIFWAIDRGLAAGVSSLIVALQPFLTAAFAFALLGERLSGLKIVCFVLALAGVFLVLFPNVSFDRLLPGINFQTVGACLVSTAAISLGAVYQKRHVQSLNLWVSTATQFGSAAIVTYLAALLFETRELVWSDSTIYSLLWLIFVLSIGAVALLMYLIRNGETTSVASLFFLVPVVAMLMSWVLFGETLQPMQVLGSLVVVASVAAASRMAKS